MPEDIEPEVEEFIPEPEENNTEYEIEDPGPDPDPEDQPDFNAEYPYEHRSWLFREFKILGKTPLQIAEENGVTENTIKQNLNRLDLS
jgi:hypothetical protein